MAPLVLTADEAAEVLGVSASTISRMVERGDLPKVDLGGARILRIPTAAIEELVTRSIVEAEARRARLDAVAS